MIRIKAEYDKYNRSFRLIDREFGSMLEDGAEYELVVPLTVAELEEQEQVVNVGQERCGHENG